VSGPSAADLSLLVPEMILVVAVLVLMLLARRIRQGQVATVGTVIAALAAGIAASQALSWGTTSGFAGMFVLDGYSQFFKLLIVATLLLATLLSVGRRSDDGVPRGDYHVLLLLAATGMMISVSAVDLIPLYLALELVTICSYILVGIRVERPASNEAAIKYFLLGSFASALLLFGISLTYGLTGTTAYEGIASALYSRGMVSQPFLLVAIGLVVGGLAFKIAAVPFHAWAPDAYQGATAPVAAFLAAGSKAAGLAALGRVLIVAFGTETAVLSPIIVGLAGLSLLVGSVLALSQTDMKRLLAYSSIAHAGYALLGLVAGTPAGVSATMTYAFFYVFMTLGAFGVVIALGARGEQLDGFQGLAAQRPAVAAVMLVFLLSLTGFPPTAGFVAKFVVITSAVQAGHIVLAILAVGCSVITAFVYMRVVVLMYMSNTVAPPPARFPLAVTAALAVAALVTLVGGVLPAGLMSWAVSP
jgi:NADH-quinone oxidoreductase subunit N